MMVTKYIEIQKTIVQLSDTKIYIEIQKTIVQLSDTKISIVLACIF